MNAASTLAAKIRPRPTERVRIVFSVPLWSSAATMSPGDERGDQREEPERAEDQDHRRDREARLAHVAPERDVVGLPGLQRERDDEDDRARAPPRRARGRSASGRRACAAPSRRRCAARPSGGLGTASAAGAGVLAAPSSVRRKNRSSSVAACGASARIASAGLDERDRQLGGRLLGRLEAQLQRVAGGRRRCRAGPRRPPARARRRSCAAASSAPAVRLRSAQRALEHDRGRCARSRRGCTAPRPRRAGGWRAGPSCRSSDEPRDERAHVAHAGRIQAGRGLVEQQQPRIAQQRRGDAETLAHAVRVAADAVALAVGQLDDVQRLVDPRRGVAAVERREQLEVLAAREVRIEARRLDEARDAVQRRARRRRSGRDPKSRTSPAVGRMSPSSIRSTVVLPAPLGPR